uniref:YopX domain-containing protein n=1 Tax=Ascaris lumbricoides TaxID=6252 RepID=A0A0M3IL23_ASCLU
MGGGNREKREIYESQRQQYRFVEYNQNRLLNAALADPVKKKYFDIKRLEEFKGFGGVRIEDDIVIWAKGNEILNDVPRTVRIEDDIVIWAKGNEILNDVPRTVRIEDDIVIWAKGNEILNDVPRTVEEIEAFMKK